MRKHPQSFQIRLITALILLSGCSNSTNRPQVELSIEDHMPTMLLTEMIASGGNRDISSKIYAKNLVSAQSEFSLAGTGCSCYGVWVDEHRCEPGEPILLEPKQELTLTLKAHAPNHESQQGYRADFSLPSPDGNQFTMRLESTFHVYQDVKVFPVVLSCQTESGQDDLFKRSIRVERIFRSATGESPAPETVQLPKGVEVGQIQRLDPPQELEENLWRAGWDVDLSIRVSGDSAGNESEDLIFQFASSPETAETTPASIVCKLNRGVRRPINCPTVVHFGRMNPGDVRERYIFMQSPENRKFQLSVDDNALPMNIQVQLNDKFDSSHRVGIKLTAPDDRELNETLQIRTNLEEQPVLEIQVLAFGEPGGN